MKTHESADCHVLQETRDFDSIRALALESGLEDGTFDNIVAAYGCFADDEMMACIALKQEGDRFSVEWLAVSREHRGKGMGSMLVGKVEDEARTRGADRNTALARAPEFFEKIGYRKSSNDELEGARLRGCLLCPQYRESCFPAYV